MTEDARSASTEWQELVIALTDLSSSYEFSFEF